MRRMKYFLLLGLLALVVVTPGRVLQQAIAPITAQVDRTMLTTDEYLTLTVIIDASTGYLTQPSVPYLDGFNILSTGMSTQMTIINGAMSVQAVYTYYLQPARTGDLIIPSFTININGVMHSTDPITIQVSPGVGGQTGAQRGAQPQTGSPSSAAPGDQVFVEAVVDNDTPYVGEQVLYHFRFYQAVRVFGQPDYEPPDFTGFWKSTQMNQQEYAADMGSQRYRVTELTNVLFPTTAGDLTIDPAVLTIPGGVFDPDIALATEPVTVRVQPLPPGAPANFSGAVGQYTITAQVDSTQVNDSNKAVEMRLEIAGIGNIDGLPDVELPDMPDWRVFPGNVTSNGAFQNGIYSGTRTYEFTLIPTAEGDITIPSITYTFFDPVIEQYAQTRTDPITIHVAPGAAEAPASQPQAQTSLAQAPTPEPEPEVASAVAEPAELHGLKAAPDSLITVGRPLTDQVAFWALWAIPALLVGADIAWRRRERHLQANAARLRSSRALRTANKALAKARRRKADVYAAVSNILTGYIADKCQQPVGGLTRLALTRLLESRGIPPELAHRVDECLQMSEAGRFSPDHNGSGRALLNETATLIKALDREFAP